MDELRIVGRSRILGTLTDAVESGRACFLWRSSMRLLLALLLALAIVTPTHAQLAAPNAAGIAFGHVHLNVKDVELHKKIWVEHFGGVVVQKGPLVAVKLPGMLIALRQADATGGSEGTVMDHFGFKVRNIAEVLKGWRAAGYQVGREFTGAEGFPNAYLTAPDEVKIEVQEDTSLPVKAEAYHLHFLLADYVKLRDWYVDTFSLAARKRGTIETTADVPGMNLSFATSRTPTVATKGRSIDHIGFEVANLAAFCQTLEKRGVKFDVPFRNVPAIGLNIAYITDPSGTYIELTEGYNKY
jgi:catechol 2,3-dioxygenase-like lactoylglutathione lyase family enzyme